MTGTAVAIDQPLSEAPAPKVRFRGYWERTFGRVADFLMPLSFLISAFTIWADSAGLSSATPALIGAHLFFTLPRLILEWRMHRGSLHPFAKELGQELDGKRQRRRFSFGGWRSMLAGGLTAVASFFGTYFAYGIAQSALVSMGMSTPWGAAISGIGTALFGIVTFAGSYGPFKTFVEKVTGKKMKAKDKDPDAFNFKRLFDLQYVQQSLKRRWKHGLGQLAAIALAGGIAAVVIPTLPFSGPAAIVCAIIFTGVTAISFKGSMEDYFKKTIDSIKRKLFGGSKKEPTEDDKIWKKLPAYKRWGYAHGLSLVTALGAAIPTVLSLAFPPAGAAALIALFAFGLYILAFKAMKGTLIKSAKAKQKAPEEVEIDADQFPSRNRSEEYCVVTKKDAKLLSSFERFKEHLLLDKQSSEASAALHTDSEEKPSSRRSTAH